jgi:type IV pilus assembly protein PilV
MILATSQMKISAPRRMSGMTLIEVLVAVIVISVGMLGIAALQMSTLKTNQESFGRTQASVLAADILDRMRANQIQLLANAYNVAANGTGTAATTAGVDLVDWQMAIDRLLGAGASGSIRTNYPADTVVTITIQWTERARQDSTLGTQAAAPVTFVTRTEI